MVLEMRSPRYRVPPSPTRAAQLLVLLITGAAAAGPSSSSLAERLVALRFNNVGVTKSTTDFTVATVPCGYLEPENVTTPQHAWAQKGKCPFVFTTNQSGGGRLLVPPPLGIRSAVPLGGIGAGSFELRGDGTLQQFTVSERSLPSLPVKSHTAYTCMAHLTGRGTWKRSKRSR